VGALAIAVATPAVLTGLQAGSTASGTGTLILTDTNPSWALAPLLTLGLSLMLIGVLLARIRQLERGIRSG
jgi:hypothetical protein